MPDNLKRNLQGSKMVIWLDKMLENYNIIKHFCDGIFIL